MATTGAIRTILLDQSRPVVRIETRSDGTTKTAELRVLWGIGQMGVLRDVIAYEELLALA